MIYNLLGSTGLNVSAIGFGASPLGDVFGKVTPEAATATVSAAIERGVNLFDVSPFYGLTLAEERLGDALVGRRDKVLLATKCGRYGMEEFDFSAAKVTREFENSLRRLKTDYVDLLQVHDIEFGSAEQVVEETLPALRRLQEQGKARFIGVTGYGPRLLARVAKDGGVDTVLNYCHSNLFSDDMDRALTPLAQERGIGLMNASPLHLGLLGGGAIPEWHPAPQSVRDAANEVIALCRQYGVAAPTVALHFCLQHPVAASTFVGLSSVAQVEANCEALEWQPDEALMSAIRKRIAPVFNYAWPSGRKENQDVVVA